VFGSAQLLKNRATNTAAGVSVERVFIRSDGMKRFELLTLS